MHIRAYARMYGHPPSPRPVVLEFHVSSVLCLQPFYLYGPPSLSMCRNYTSLIDFGLLVHFSIPLIRPHFCVTFIALWLSLYVHASQPDLFIYLRVVNDVSNSEYTAPND
jgi:hypothetical protein